MLVVVAITLVFLHGTKSRSALVGILCIIFNIMMYTSPLTVMVRLFVYFKTKLVFVKKKKKKQIDELIFFIFFSKNLQTRVIKTKSVKYMPFYLSLANFANGIVWFIYALIKLDPFVLVKKKYSSNHLFRTVF